MNTRIPLIGLLFIQLFVGYEWFVSGLTKIVRGGFVSGLADELGEKSVGAPGWYKSFLDGTVIPNASGFGYAIETAEVAAGIGLIAAAAVWLIGWDRLSDVGRVGVLATTIVASLAGVVMAVNFHLANGAPHPWFIGRDGFDEGIDLDSLLPAIQLVLIGVSVGVWTTLRRGSKRRAAIREPWRGEVQVGAR